eukprot:scaffold735_cov255-Pinguiococcus_pyrenoidosus.AAC.33
MMSPDVATIVVRNKLRRPKTGMPASWRRANVHSAPQAKRVKAEAVAATSATSLPRLPQLSAPSFPNPLKALKEGLTKIAILRRVQTVGQSLNGHTDKTLRTIAWLVVCGASFYALPYVAPYVSKGATHLASRAAAGAVSLAGRAKVAGKSVAAWSTAVYASTSEFILEKIKAIRARWAARREPQRRPQNATYRDIEPKLAAIKKRYDLRKFTPRCVQGASTWFSRGEQSHGPLVLCW